MIADQFPVAITMADDTVAIMSFVFREYKPEGGVSWEREPTDYEIGMEVLAASRGFDPHQKPVKGWRRITPEEVPKDRTFRNAYRDDGKQLYIDMVHARRIHMDHIREVRAMKWAELDKDWLIAFAQGRIEDAAKIEAHKQVLRDLPKTIDLEKATTPEELKNIWPAELPPP